MNLDEIKRANAAHGHHRFEPGTMRFFDCRVSERVMGRFFVSSERGPDGIRKYTVRRAMEDGSINDVGGFQQYASLSGAVRAATRAHLAEPYPSPGEEEA